MVLWEHLFLGRTEERAKEVFGQHGVRGNTSFRPTRIWGQNCFRPTRLSGKHCFRATTAFGPTLLRANTAFGPSPLLAHPTFGAALISCLTRFWPNIHIGRCRLSGPSVFVPSPYYPNHPFYATWPHCHPLLTLNTTPTTTIHRTTQP